MLVKFLNSDSVVSTAIAGSYFKGDGWTGAYYDSGTGQLVFESEDDLGFTTGDLRVSTGGTSTVEWTTVLNKPTSFPPSTHTHLWADITDKPTEFTPVSHNHTISEVTGLQGVIDDKADKSQILTQQQFRDSVAAMFQSGTHTNVSINYDSVPVTIPDRFSIFEIAIRSSTEQTPNGGIAARVNNTEVTAAFATATGAGVVNINKVFAENIDRSAAYRATIMFTVPNDFTPARLAIVRRMLGLKRDAMNTALGI